MDKKEIAVCVPKIIARSETEERGGSSGRRAGAYRRLCMAERCAAESVWACLSLCKVRARYDAR